MKHFKKVVACVLKDLDGNTPKILAFEHPPPLSDYQIPKGTVEVGEDLENAVLRELEEESGLQQVQIIGTIDAFDIICAGGPNGDQGLERQSWYLFHLQVLEFPLTRWSHTVTGEGVDTGLVYRYFWHDLNGPSDNFHEKFVKLMDSVRAYLNH